MKRFITLCFLCFNTLAFGDNIGLLVMATGKYIQFVPPLVNSAKQHFLTNHHVTYYIFSDKLMEPMDNVVLIYQERLGWPFDTMMRHHVYCKHENLYEKEDYLFACDADMLFVDAVGDEILGERVATLHPGFTNMRGSYETDPTSLACVFDDEGEHYFAGGFYGGTKESVMHICKTCSQNADSDLEKGIIAVWHDESHWNRYCTDHPPTVILSPSYCYPESWFLPFHKRLLALDKDHAACREDES